MSGRKRVEHPGWECCTRPPGDLLRWLDQQYDRARAEYAEAAIHRRLGDHFRAHGLHDTARTAYLRANCIAQGAGIDRGHARRVEAAHRHRFVPVTPRIREGLL